ncbi:cysteine--tRNA ligase [Spirochaetia bacterium]|nr:cysteine--tRNA ligase [Spirochaetia bacterium]
MALSLFNTLGREIQPFVPITAGKAGFYGCGPTVYNYAHIGNLRAYVLHDLLVRTLRRQGLTVTHVMNITDVGHLSGDNDDGDDKMVRSAGERGKSVLEVADFYTQAFFRDTERMNIIRPTVVCKATEHIGDMIELIKKIEAGGFTYSAGGNLYYDVGKFPHYGDLALLRLGEQRSRTGADENKRNPQDFVLWFTRSKFENQALVWDSPWGKGYPGWHIECSAMSIKYLGEQFDIHAGGIDHIPIHHTNEIAQSEAATGKHPWVKYWVHNEFLVLDREKMSKSSGSFLTLQTLIDSGYDALDYRYFLLGGHYRSQLQFSYEALDGARNARKSLREKLRVLTGKVDDAALQAILRTAALPVAGDSAAETAILPKPVTGGKAGTYIEAFNKALDDDLSSPRALAELWGLLRDTEIAPGDALAAALDMDRVLGLGIAEAVTEASAKAGTKQAGGPGGEADQGLAQEIEALIAERTAAKKVKDFAKADGIRNSLKEQGIILEDSPAGTVWRRT